MNRFFLVGWILFWVSACSSNRDNAHQTFTITEKYPVNSLQVDFHQVLRVIKKNHPALYDFIGKDEYERLIEEQYEKIDDSLTITEFYHIILPVLNRIGCGHTTARLPDWVWNDSSISFLPLRLFFQNNRAYVVNNYSTYDNLPAGTEIVSINGMAIPTLLQTIGDCVATDGINVSAKIERLNKSFAEYLATYTHFPNEYEIGLQVSSDSVQKLWLPSFSAQRYFETRLQPDSVLLFEIDSVKSTATITIRSFGFYENNDEFKAFVDRSFKLIQSAKIDHVILDLRNNSGGDPFCASYLLTHLVEKPITYFSQQYSTYTDLAKTLPVSTNHFSGNLYTLINGGCFSTTGHLCALLRYHDRGEFFGTETGGTYTCNDNAETFRLINTGILLRIARTTFTVAVDGIPRFRGITADYIVDPTLQDVLAGKDPEKQFVQTRIEKP